MRGRRRLSRLRARAARGARVFCRLEHVVPWAIQGAHWEAGAVDRAAPSSTTGGPLLALRGRARRRPRAPRPPPRRAPDRRRLLLGRAHGASGRRRAGAGSEARAIEPRRRRDQGRVGRLPAREAADDAGPVPADAQRAAAGMQPVDGPRPRRRLRRGDDAGCAARLGRSAGPAPRAAPGAGRRSSATSTTRPTGSTRPRSRCSRC